MKRLILMGLIGLMGLTGSLTYGQKETGDERTTGLYRQAMDLYQKQKYSAAQQIFDQVAALGATADAQWLTISDACYYAGVCSEKLDNDDAYFRLEEFLRFYPQSARQDMARFYLGNFYYARGDYDRALEYYKAVDPKEVEYDHRSEYNFKKGYCYFQKGDTKHASELFSQQVGGKSKYSASSLYYYAHIQYMNGQYDLALRNFRELQGDKKFSKIAPSYIARIYYYLGKDDELNDFTVSADPMLSELQGLLAGVEIGKPETAAGKLNSILSNKVLFGSDLYEVGLGEKIEGMFRELIAGKGAVRATLVKYMGE